MPSPPGGPRGPVFPAKPCKPGRQRNKRFKKSTIHFFLLPWFPSLPGGPRGPDSPGGPKIYDSLYMCTNNQATIYLEVQCFLVYPFLHFVRDFQANPKKIEFEANEIIKTCNILEDRLNLDDPWLLSDLHLHDLPLFLRFQEVQIFLQFY